MSSANLVRLTAIEETVYGETPVAGNFKTARFTSEALSGTPDTSESQSIRTDRLSSGQVVVGLTVGGDVNSELAKEDITDDFIESAMYSSWDAKAPVAVDLTIDTTAKTIVRAAGDWTVDVEVGDVLTLTAFADSNNNTEVMVTEVQNATTIRFSGPDTMVDEVGVGTSYQIADEIEIGITQKSFSMEKAFLDLTDKAINYRGMIVSTMNHSVTYGEIVNSTFGFQGNDYQPVEAAANFITDGRTIDSPATSNSLNGSVDMPFLINNASGTLDTSDFCIQSVDLNLNNNATAQTCVGQAAPDSYNAGTAQIEVSLTAYLANENWAMLAKKLTQDPISLGFIVKNSDGFYGFFLPAVQLSFEDPASTGINQDVFLNMTGVAKVGASNEKSLKMFRS
jgi:hypothetical protein